MLRSTGRLSRMIDQLVEITRLCVGRGIALAPVAADLATIARTIVDDARTAAGPAAPSIGLAVEGDAGGVWDPERVGQLIAGLVGNAIDYGAPGGPIEIEVDGRAPDAVVVSIHNRGAIAPEALGLMFDPFRPGRRKGTRASGLGLGSYIGRAIAAAHGGSLEVTTDPTPRTTATVRLPRGR
jgi:signal transduction histidine kinase